MHYWNMCPFSWLPGIVRADCSKPLSCLLPLPLILIISHLPEGWPELFPSVAKDNSQAWEARRQGLAVLETSLCLAEEPGPIVAAGALGTAQMPRGNCISQMTRPEPPSPGG